MLLASSTTRETPELSPPVSSSPETKRRKPNILVIDDDQRMGDALLRSLQDSFDVTVETEAPDACQRLAIGERYSAVLMDIVMPGMNGVDLYQWMSGACPDQADRVLFITGAQADAQVRSFLKHNADRVVAKPFDRENLLARIETLLGAS